MFYTQELATFQIPYYCEYNYIWTNRINIKVVSVWGGWIIQYTEFRVSTVNVHFVKIINHIMENI